MIHIRWEHDMSEMRNCIGVVNGMPTSDGAGVSLLRVVGTPQIDYLDPFLICLLYTSPSPRDLSTSRMPSSA